MKKAVLSLSGGMDSSTVLLHLLEKGYEVKAIAFDYGQKHSVELEKARDLWEYLETYKLVKSENFNIIEMNLENLLHSNLVKGGGDVPEGHYEEENMKQTVVPNRNKIFASIIQAAALSWAIETESSVDIAMGIHAGDHAIYPDCREEFRNADFKAFQLGNWDADRINIYTPYLHGDKSTILQDGLRCCESLRIEFDEVYKRTNTSYKPIKINDVWFSDYKSASSVERVEAFISIGRPDPVSYADENGLVTWDFVKKYVTDILEGHKILKEK